MNRALEKGLKPNHTIIDSTKKVIITPDIHFDGKFPQPEINQPVIITGGRGAKTKYVRLPGDTVYLDTDCPGDTITYYEKQYVDVYKLPPTYKEFIKELFGLSNLEFWISHILLGLGALGFIYIKILIPKWPKLKI